jgi:hypothetical protein
VKIMKKVRKVNQQHQQALSPVVTVQGTLVVGVLALVTTQGAQEVGVILELER